MRISKKIIFFSVPFLLPAAMSRAQVLDLYFSTYLGGARDDRAVGLCLVDSGYVYITGSTLSSDFPVYNPYHGFYSGGFDTFLTKLSLIGEDIVYSTYIGGSDHDYCIDVMTDGGGYATVTGRSKSLNYPLMDPTQSLNAGGWDGYITTFSPQGLGLPGWETVNGFTIDVSPNPFSRTLLISYTAPGAGDYTITLYDISGRQLFIGETTASGNSRQSLEWTPTLDYSGLILICVRGPGEFRATAEALLLAGSVDR